MKLAKHTIYFGSLLAASTLIIGCGGNTGRNHASTTAPSTSGGIGSVNTQIGVAPVNTSTMVSGHGTVQIAQANGGPVYWILRDDGKEFEVLNPADLTAQNVKENRGITFEGEVLANLTATKGDPLQLNKFTLDPVKPSTPTTPTNPTKPPARKAIPWILRSDMTAKLYQTRVDAYGKRGYSVESVTVRGTKVSKARFTAIWVKDGRDRVARHGLSALGFAKEFIRLARKGYRTTTIDSYGKYPAERYAATWVKSKIPYVVRFRMSSSTYQKNFEKYSKLGYRAVWISAKGTSKSKAKFAAIWIKSKVSSRAVHDRRHREFKKLAPKYAKEGYRPLSIASYGFPIFSPKMAGVFVKSSLKPRTFINQSRKSYQKTVNSLIKLGYRPVNVIQGDMNRMTHTWIKLGKVNQSKVLAALLKALKAKTKLPFPFKKKSATANPPKSPLTSGSSSNGGSTTKTKAKFKFGVKFKLGPISPFNSNP